MDINAVFNILIILFGLLLLIFARRFIDIGIRKTRWDSYFNRRGVRKARLISVYVVGAFFIIIGTFLLLVRYLY